MATGVDRYAQREGDSNMPVVKAGLKASDIMTADPVCIRPSATIAELARLLEDSEISGVPVTNQQGKVVGIVSKSDLVRRALQGTGEIAPAYLFELLGDLGNDDEVSEIQPEIEICVEDIMTEDPLMVALGGSVIEVARLMHTAHVHRVVVVDKDQFPVGIITSMDLLGALAQSQ
jgi:CBS domain-containing protein